jgi:putative flippase GtrA
MTGLFAKRYLAYMSAAVLANILAIINAYLFYKYLTFQSRCAGRASLLNFRAFSQPICSA